MNMEELYMTYKSQCEMVENANHSDLDPQHLDVAHQDWYTDEIH